VSKQMAAVCLYSHRRSVKLRSPASCTHHETAKPHREGLRAVRLCTCLPNVQRLAAFHHYAWGQRVATRVHKCIVRVGYNVSDLQQTDKFPVMILQCSADGEWLQESNPLVQSEATYLPSTVHIQSRRSPCIPNACKARTSFITLRCG
jgi:hypothetical protein